MFMTMARGNPIDELRRPCPACGQPIHPVAGRCKHCRTDLLKLREAHARPPKVEASVLGAAAAATQAPPPSPFAAPAAPVTLPAGVAGSAPGNGAPNGYQAVAAPTNGIDLIAPPAYASYPEVPPVLRSAWSRRWPTLVVVLAGIAIAVCAYLLLVDGESHASGGVKQHAASPAPDRMETMPQAPSPMMPGPGSQAQPNLPGTPTDPWGPSAPDPTPAPPAPPSATPRSAPAADQFYPTMMSTLCQKMKSCAKGFGGQSIDDLCSTLTTTNLFADEIRAGKCTYDEQKASRCLSAIDAFACDPASSGDVTQLLNGLGGISDCTDALSCPP